MAPTILIYLLEPFGQYGYDKVGNRTSVGLADGYTNTYQYDPLNRLRQLTYGTDGQTVIYRQEMDFKP